MPPFLFLEATRTAAIYFHECFMADKFHCWQDSCDGTRPLLWFVDWFSRGIFRRLDRRSFDARLGIISRAAVALFAFRDPRFSSAGDKSIAGFLFSRGLDRHSRMGAAGSIDSRSCA